MEKSENLLNPSKNLIPHIILEIKALYEFLIIKTRSEPPLRNFMQHKLSDMTDAECFVLTKCGDYRPLPLKTGKGRSFYFSQDRPSNSSHLKI